MRIGLGDATEFFHPRLKHGAASPFDPIAPAVLLGEKSLTFSFIRAFTPKHRMAVASWRTQFQIASSALKLGPSPGRFTKRRRNPGVAK